jgi:hypothetical protein
VDPVIVRVYKSKSQSSAAKEYGNDAAKLARQGYVPVSQSWEPGKSGCLRFLFTLGLSAWIFKPAGSLTVTYRIEQPQPQPQIPPQ